METNPLQTALDRRLASHGPDSVINLIDSNFLDNGFLFPSGILEDGMKRYLAGRRYHPDPRGTLPARQAIADWYRRDCYAEGGPEAGAWARPDNILLTASSSESYNLLFQAFTEPGDNILLPNPGYPLFEDLCRYNRLEPRFYPLNEASAWQPDLDILDSLADGRSRFLVLISPNNPCGSILGEGELAAILEIARRHELMIISDEVFSAFRYVPGPLPRIADTNSAQGSPVPVFTINGISKLLACPDLKLSWLVCTGPEESCALPTVEEVLRELELRNDTFLNCNSLSQFLLPDLFAQGDPFTASMVERLAANRRQLAERFLPALPDGCRMVLPTGGIHFLLSFSRYRVADDEALAVALVNRGLYLHPGYLYGVDDHPALAMSLLKDPAAFAEGLARLAEALSSLI
jgi:aspartate/methionine/tyrosine aminotransferase